MRKVIALGLFVLVAGVGPASAMAFQSFTFCARELGDVLSVNVTFKNASEIGLTLSREDETIVTTFNNYFGRGAGDVWKSGGKRITITMKKSKCLTLTSKHKLGGPNPAVQWVDGAGKIYPRSVIGFESDSDGDFDDAMIETIGTDAGGKSYDPNVKGSMKGDIAQ